MCEQAGVDRSEIAHVLHGTTVATNAIVEGKGATVGLVTTEGFRQVLQIARSFVPGGLAGWIIWPKPEPLAALENTVEVPGRIASDGSVVRELDEDAARAQLRRLRDAGIEALAVSLINAFANDAHERRVGELAAEELPGVPVSLSSRVLPELREYERALTTVANGYVQPQVARYVANLGEQLAAAREAGHAARLPAHRRRRRLRRPEPGHPRRQHRRPAGQVRRHRHDRGGHHPVHCLNICPWRVTMEACPRLSRSWPPSRW